VRFEKNQTSQTIYDLSKLSFLLVLSAIIRNYVLLTYYWDY